MLLVSSREDSLQKTLNVCCHFNLSSIWFNYLSEKNIDCLFLFKEKEITAIRQNVTPGVRFMKLCEESQLNLYLCKKTEICKCIILVIFIKLCMQMVGSYIYSPVLPFIHKWIEINISGLHIDTITKQFKRLELHQ